MDFDNIKNMKDLHKAITPTPKETVKIFDACASLARDGIATAFIMPKFRDEMINVGAHAIDNGKIINRFAEQIRKDHKENPELRAAFCEEQSILEEEFDLMVIGLFQIGVWLNLASVTKRKLKGFVSGFAKHLTEDDD